MYQVLLLEPAAGRADSSGSVGLRLGGKASSDILTAHGDWKRIFAYSATLIFFGDGAPRILATRNPPKTLALPKGSAAGL